MQAVILAAGLGTRLSSVIKDCPKGLIKVAGRECLFRHLYLLSKGGVNEFIIIVNEKNKEAYQRFLKQYPFHYRLVVNPYPERENGYSFYLAKDYVSGPFVLTMSDHVYEPDFVFRAIKKQGLIIDQEGKYIDHFEATKVLCKRRCIKKIGKDLSVYDGFDTGFFILNPEIFEIAEALVSTKEHVKLSEIVEIAKIPVTPISGLFWMDIDTAEDIKKAAKFLVKTAVKDSGDGFISRHLNRKVSTTCTRYLVDKITPNQATVFSFLLGLFSSISVIVSPIFGGILYQLSSMLDGIDGEIARTALKSSPFGGWLDSVLDRYVDFAFLWALALYIRPKGPFMLSVILLTIFGSLMVSYSTERYRGAFYKDAYIVLRPLRYIPGKRDERVFLTMLFCLFGWVKELFLLLAVVTNLRLFFTILLVWQKKGKTKNVLKAQPSHLKQAP